MYGVNGVSQRVSGWSQVSSRGVTTMTFGHIYHMAGWEIAVVKRCGVGGYAVMAVGKAGV